MVDTVGEGNAEKTKADTPNGSKQLGAGRLVKPIERDSEDGDPETNNYTNMAQKLTHPPQLSYSKYPKYTNKIRKRRQRNFC